MDKAKQEQNKHISLNIPQNETQNIPAKCACDACPAVGAGWPGWICAAVPRLSQLPVPTGDGGSRSEMEGTTMVPCNYLYHSQI